MRPRFTATVLLLLAGAPVLAQTTSPPETPPTAPESTAQPPVQGPEEEPPKPGILLADTAHRPTVRISWPAQDGKVTELSGTRAYRSQGDATLLGKNIEAYLALGGTRLDRSLGNPDGATIRFGLYKADTAKPFFADIADGATVTIRITGVRMNQPAKPDQKTGLMHLKYMLSDLKACGIDPTGRNLFVTVDPEDPIKPTVTQGSGKFGHLDGAAGHGSATGTVEGDGSITIVFAFPYHTLRHTGDPSQRTLPGGFFEPQHFHVEMEVVPAESPAVDPSQKPD